MKIMMKMLFIFYIKKCNDNQYKIIIAEGEKNKNQKFRFNIFESIYNNNNFDSFVFQSLFDDEKILILNNIEINDGNNLNTIIKTILETNKKCPFINESNSYILNDSKIININKFNYLYYEKQNQTNEKKGKKEKEIVNKIKIEEKRKLNEENKKLNDENNKKIKNENDINNNFKIKDEINRLKK